LQEKALRDFSIQQSGLKAIPQWNWVIAARIEDPVLLVGGA
jgi:hypothetical protein